MQRRGRPARGQMSPGRARDKEHKTITDANGREHRVGEPAKQDLGPSPAATMPLPCVPQGTWTPRRGRSPPDRLISTHSRKLTWR
jgi:hypothetical protein